MERDVPGALIPTSDVRVVIGPAELRGVLWRRAAAYAVDVALISVLGVIAVAVSFPFIVLSFGLLASPFSLLFAIIPISYHTLLIGGPTSATIGQWLFDLRVIDLNGGRPSYAQAFVQSALFYVTVFPTSFLILAFVFFNRHRRTLHDWLSGTLVVRRTSIGGGVHQSPFTPT